VGPVSAPPPPPPSLPPYGGPPLHQPPSSANTWTGILLGALVIGPALAVLVPLMVIGVAANSSGNGLSGAFVILGLVLPWLVGIPLLFFRGARPWGLGILIGVALTEIVLGGSCYLILTGLGNA
jgi:hypothetical protein